MLITECILMYMITLLDSTLCGQICPSDYMHRYQMPYTMSRLIAIYTHILSSTSTRIDISSGATKNTCSHPWLSTNTHCTS